MKTNLFLFLNLLLLSSCGYQQDKLVVVNNTKDTICYGTLTKDKKDGIFYSVSGDGEINPHEKSSPPVRGTVEFNMQDRNADGNLYVMYFSPKDRESVYENIDNAAKSGKFKIEKFSKEELDKKNWVVNHSE